MSFLVDGKLIGEVKPNETLWKLGDFNKAYENPWRFATKLAPFDQEVRFFYYMRLGLTILRVDLPLNLNKIN